MNTTPPSKRRRIAGETKPGEAAVSPAANLPRAPKRTDTPKPPKPSKVEGAMPAKLRGARELSVGTWALVALTIAAIAFGISGVIAGARHFSGEDVATTREDASDAAASAAETIFTYQWNKLKQHESESTDLMTPKFAKKFESIAPALNALAPQRRIQVKGVVRNAATLECGDDCVENRAKVLVFIDQARVADGAEKPTVFGNRIEMTMVKRNGDWLVDNVKAL